MKKFTFKDISKNSQIVLHVMVIAEYHNAILPYSNIFKSLASQS